ncbi:TetR/AcrR family transcriptional regulator [Qipengyuania sp. NPDC077563]|uniref:TetR/AcrR family transcriptional regulator n=1 Tax=Qipengyuania sp. NPDC077563 TaxID=3364497 RepID=UPI00384D420E
MAEKDTSSTRTPTRAPAPTPDRADAMRAKILDGAERLLRTGKADFSMRDLAAEAGVSFATPFNRFGSKLAIMRALSARRIDAMIARYGTEAPAGDVPPDLPTRVALAIDIAVDTMLAQPQVNRAVMGAIGSPPAGQDEPAVRVLDHSTMLWEKAVGADASPADPDLPQRLAFAFRGVLSFWTAGELPDETLRPAAHAMAGALMPEG